MPYEERDGEATVWVNDVAGTRRPRLSGTFIAHRDIRVGEKVQIALWGADDNGNKARESRGGKQFFRGEISDMYNGERDGGRRDDHRGLDDEIPF
jgi:hypothetical protein